ncbi:MAG: hypothetical protein RL333_630 [Pseudomonadota bacterium]|jgi:uncharacterized protein YaiI (UPF0178 family)
MRIWVDADACPTVIKDILFRAAERTQVQVTFVANQNIHTPPSRFIDSMRVKPGFDVADNEILRRLAPEDLVITGDIPLAAEVIKSGGHALNPRGERYTVENIRARLNMRDFMESLRSSGIQTGGPQALGPKERMAFANQLDTILQRRKSGAQ